MESCSFNACVNGRGIPLLLCHMSVVGRNNIEILTLNCMTLHYNIHDERDIFEIKIS